MRTLNLRKLVVAGLVAAVVMALPGVAFATSEVEETEPVDLSAEVESTLPVLGSGLTVTVTTDESGAIASVALDHDGATVEREEDHLVAFLLEDGDTEIVVRAFGGVVQTKVKADATEDVSGDGVWSADVFGNGVVSIPYTVSFDGDTPIITIGSITTPSDVTAEVGEPGSKSSEDANRSGTRIKVYLTSGEDTAKVAFNATTRVDDEGELKAKVSATLVSGDRVHCNFGKRGHGGEVRGDGERSKSGDHDGDRRNGRNGKRDKSGR